MEKSNLPDSLSVLTTGQTIQQQLTKSEKALHHSEDLREELQNEVDLHKKESLHHQDLRQELQDYIDLRTDVLIHSEELQHELQHEVDIHKQMEWALRDSSNVLAINNTELQAHIEELVKRNQELDAFAHTVAHDLRNPLAGIVNLTDCLVRMCVKGTPMDAKFIERLRMVNRAGQQDLDIVDALLLLAGVSRQQQVEKHQVNMSQVVKNVTQQRLADMIEEYQGRLTLPPVWPIVESYAPWLSEVWTNYISNGLKYGGKPPQLELGYQVKEDEKKRVRFWVRDNGTGLTPDQQAKLFIPFTRLHQTPAEGHGLGLSIVHQIIGKLGGLVGVNSTLGLGSCFYFELPVAC